MLSKEQFYITEEIHSEVLNNIDTYYFQLDKFKDLECNTLFLWVYNKVREHETLWLYLTMVGKRKEFALNSYYFVLQTAKENIKYQQHKVWRFSLEISKRQLMAILEKYDNIKLSI